VLLGAPPARACINPVIGESDVGVRLGPKIPTPLDPAKGHQQRSRDLGRPGRSRRHRQASGCLPFLDHINTLVGTRHPRLRHRRHRIGEFVARLEQSRTAPQCAEPPAPSFRPLRPRRSSRPTVPNTGWPVEGSNASGTDQCRRLDASLCRDS
jgi:hypothetical protein